MTRLMQNGYAPKSIDHAFHDVLSAVLRTAVKWGHLQDNPAHGVDLPRLRTVRRPKMGADDRTSRGTIERAPTVGAHHGGVGVALSAFAEANCSRSGGGMWTIRRDA